MSIPTRSMSSKGPIRNPPSSRQMRSISSGVAMPSCSSRSASSPHGRLQRFTRNPGPSAASITRLPMARPAARTTSSARSSDRAPAMTSTSSMSGAGLKKCMPTTRPGLGTAAASAVTCSEEVFVASTQSGPTIPASVVNSSCLSRSDSGAASTTSSQGAKSSSVLAASRRPAAACASSFDQRPRAAPFSRSRGIFSSAASRASPTGSCSSVRAPDRQASWAIPAPIVPAPTTPMVAGAAGSLTRGRAR